MVLEGESRFDLDLCVWRSYFCVGLFVRLGQNGDKKLRLFKGIYYVSVQGWLGFKDIGQYTFVIWRQWKGD